MTLMRFNQVTISHAVFSFTPLRALQILTLAPSLFLSGSSSGQPQSSPELSIRLQGEVHRSEKFEQEIGRRLVFRLVPDEFGWSIQVGPKNGTDDYMDCVNGPLHGITPYQIEGWLFRNDDNTAARKPFELLTPAVGERREFQFVLTAADEARSCADLDRAEHSHDQKVTERIAATNLIGAYAGGDGSVTITSMTLGNLKPGAQAWIESMRFEATFSFRTPSDEKHGR
jgi:hypothetical protein